MLKYIYILISFIAFTYTTSAANTNYSTNNGAEQKSDLLKVFTSITKKFDAYDKNSTDAQLIGSIVLTYDSTIDLKNKKIIIDSIKGHFIAIDESINYDSIFINSNIFNKKIRIKLDKSKSNNINAQLSMFKDLILDKCDKNKQNIQLIANEATNSITIIQSASNENSQIFKRKLYDQKHGFYASFNWSPGFAYRRLNYNSTESYAEQFQERAYNEKPLFIGKNLSIKLGYIVGYNHYLFASLGTETMGFKTTKPSGYDWNQGVQNNQNNLINSFTFKSTSIGLGYKYVMFKQYDHIYPMLGTSFHYHIKPYQNEKNSSTLQMFKDNYWPTNFASIKINAGIGIAFTRFLNLAIEPYFIKNLATYQASVLSTRFMNFGINLGLEYRSKNKLKNHN